MKILEFINLGNNFLIYFYILVFLLIILLYLLINIGKIKNKYEFELFNSIIKNLDTIYIMFDKNTNKILHVTKNVYKVLGIEKAGNENSEAIVREIFSIPIIKSELKKWDGKSEFATQMVLYKNPKYLCDIWIRLKVYPFYNKKKEYTIITITDCTKEHDRQHLLISQASDIKLRQQQLNKITSSTYDIEINININNETYEMKYLKSDIKYLNGELKGSYEDLLNLFKLNIKTSDLDNVLDRISLNNLKRLVEEKDYNPFTLRYRIGQELKNNIWLESTIFIIPMNDNVNVTILTKDVTLDAQSIRNQNIQLQNALNEARIANKTKTEYLQTISHGIRTPMSVIEGLSDDLLSKNMPEDIKDDIKNINEASNEVINIINELLDIKSIEKGMIKKEEKPYNLNKLFDSLLIEAKDYLGDKNVKVNLKMDSNLPVSLNGDKKRLKQIFSNILINAVKYTDEGEINISVKFSKNNKKGDLIVIISDTGIGMKQEKLDEVLNIDGENGISNVKKMLDLLDGSIEIESKEHEYTKVTISITQKIVEDNKVRTLIDHQKQTENIDYNYKKVLVVDDNKLNIKVARRLLERYNLDVTALESGNECIDLIKEGRNFDLILLDQMMPGLTGIETLNELKSIPGFKTPIVILTADAMVGKKEEYLNAGFDDYLSKPIDKLELNKVLQKFL